MSWLPPDIIKGYDEDPHAERNEGQIFVTVIVEVYRVAVKNEKFTDHPVRVGEDPEYNSQVVTKFTHVTARADSDYDGNDQCW